MILSEVLTSKEAMKEKSLPTYSHMPIVASKLAEASRFPVGDHEICRTVRVWEESNTAYATTAPSQPNYCPHSSKVDSEQWTENETLQAHVAEEGELPGECSQMRMVLSPLQDARTEEPPHGLHATPQALAHTHTHDFFTYQTLEILRKFRLIKKDWSVVYRSSCPSNSCTNRNDMPANARITQQNIKTLNLQIRERVSSCSKP